MEELLKSFCSWENMSEEKGKELGVCGTLLQSCIAGAKKSAKVRVLLTSWTLYYVS
jgi:hypothetical protein